jgi:DNA-binding MarR family transcriptional regulator
MAHPKPWHRNSVFGAGPRVPMCRERRAQWKARIELQRRAGRITSDHAHVGLALLRRLGTDGRCDPSIQTLAADSGESLSTVGRALKRLSQYGLVMWVRRLRRDGTRVSQDSNAYLLTLGEMPIPVVRCDRQSAHETVKLVIPSVSEVSAADVAAAQAALARRRAVVEASLLMKGSGRGVIG